MKFPARFIAIVVLLLAAPVALQSSSITINLLRLNYFRVGEVPLIPPNKPYLTGIVHLLGGKGGPLLLNKTNNSPSLTKAWVDAFRWRLSWEDIQPTSAASYNWGDIDAALVTCANNNKKLSLSIVSGVGTPAWVYDTAPTCDRFSFTNKDGLPDEMPLPFQTGYQTKWLTFITAFGARYDGNAALGAVFFTGVGQENAELHITGNATDEAAWNAKAIEAPYNYADKSAAFRAAATVIVDAFVTAFPTTPAMFTSGNPWHGGPTGIADRDFIQAYVIAKPDDLRGLCSSYLHAKAASEHTNLGLKRGYPYGDQAIYNSGDELRFYSDPIPNPYPTAPTPVYDLLQAAYEKGDQYVEVYEADLQPTTANDGVLASQRLKLIENAQP